MPAPEQRVVDGDRGPAPQRRIENRGFPACLAEARAKAGQGRCTTVDRDANRSRGTQGIHFDDVCHGCGDCGAGRQGNPEIHRRPHARTDDVRCGVIVSKARANDTTVQLGVLVLGERSSIALDLHGGQRDLHLKKVGDLELVDELNTSLLVERDRRLGHEQIDRLDQRWPL